MRVEKSPPLVIHGEQPKDFFFFFSPVGRAACSKDNVSPSGRQSPSKVTNSSWIVGSSMDRRSIDLVFARNDEPPSPPFAAIFLLSPHPSSLLFSLPRSLRPRFVQASQGWERFSRSNGPPMRTHARTSRLRKSSSLFSHSKIFSLLSPPLCLSLSLSLSISGGDHHLPPLHARSFRLFTIVFTCISLSIILLSSLTSSTDAPSSCVKG